MKELFPLNTFQQDAVLKRLNDLLDNDKELDDKMPYDEDTNTFSLDGDLSVIGDANVSGTVTINGDATVDGNITGDSIIENMSGYSFSPYQDLPNSEIVYAGVCKNGNKITFVIFGTFEKNSETESSEYIGYFTIPESIGEKLYPYALASNTTLAQNLLAVSSDISLSNIKTISYLVQKNSNAIVAFSIKGADTLTNGTTYYYRIEQTFLLSDNLIPQP